MNMLSICIFFIPETNKNLKQGLITWNKSQVILKSNEYEKYLIVIFLINFLFLVGGFTFYNFFWYFFLNKFNF